MLTKNTLFGVFLFLTMLFIIELVSFSVGYLLSDKGFFYSGSRVAENIIHGESEDPLLGWPTTIALANGQRDSTGSRINPLYPESEPNCLSVYGESYAWSFGTDAENAWTTWLSGDIDCRVSNFSVIGYGSDQSFLRFQQNHQDRSPVVFLIHLSENIMRNVNQFSPLLFPHTRVGLKPRFILDASNELQLIPKPSLTDKDYEQLLEDPGSQLEHEYFTPGGVAGISVHSFPYTWSMLKVLNNHAFRARVRQQPKHMAFYQPGHPSGGLELTARILESFQDTARAQHRKPVVILLPTRGDIRYWRAHNIWPYADLPARLDALGVDFVDFGPRMAQAMENKDPDAYWHQGHPNAAGYKLITKIVYSMLTEKKLIELLK